MSLNQEVEPGDWGAMEVRIHRAEYQRGEGYKRELRRSAEVPFKNLAEY